MNHRRDCVGKGGNEARIPAGHSGESTKLALSPARRRLIELMQDINFGRIEKLAVEKGEPLFDPPPRVVREIKFGGENGPRRELGSEDFVLKSQITELFAQLDRLGEGTVECLEVRHGLPFRMNVEEPVAA